MIVYGQFGCLSLGVTHISMVKISVPVLNIDTGVVSATDTISTDFYTLREPDVKLIFIFFITELKYQTLKEYFLQILLTEFQKHNFFGSIIKYLRELNFGFWLLILKQKYKKRMVMNQFQKKKSRVQYISTFF